MNEQQEGNEQRPDRGRYLKAIAQIRLVGDPMGPPWAALPLYENQLELALTWMRNNHATLVAELPDE